MKQFKQWLVSEELETTEPIQTLIDMAHNLCPLSINVDAEDDVVYIKSWANVIICNVAEFLEMADYVRKKSTEELK